MLSADVYIQLLKYIFANYGLNVQRVFPPDRTEAKCLLEGRSFLGAAELESQQSGFSFILRFPYPTSRGTLILNGKEYAPTYFRDIHQARIRILPGDLWELEHILRRIFYRNYRLPKGATICVSENQQIPTGQVLQLGYLGDPSRPCYVYWSDCQGTVVEIKQTKRSTRIIVRRNDVTNYELEAALNRLTYPFVYLLQSTNPLAEVSDRRKVILLYSGKRPPERLRYIRDSERGRLCPLETPETEHIGLRRFLARQATLCITGNRLTIQTGSQQNGDILGLSASLVPFLHHNDGARAMMGAKNMKQALPLKDPEPPLIRTGWEEKIAELSGWVVRAEREGTVVDINETAIRVQYDGDDKIREYPLVPLHPTPEGVPAGQILRVNKNQRVDAGKVLAEGPAMREGVLALGRNVLVAYMPFFGYNFEDGIVVSESVAQKFTSLHMYEYALERSDEDDDEWRRVVRVEEDQPVEHGCKLLVSERRGLEVLYDRYAKGRVVRVLRNDWRAAVWIEAERPLEVGDKLINRHGGKGVVTRILPDNGMPWFRCKDNGCSCQRGQVHRIEVILNPASVVSRMNLGQLLETHWGWVAHKKGENRIFEPFADARLDELKKLLRCTGLPEGKAEEVRLGNRNLGRVVVGYQYIMKVNQLASDKFHVRAVGPYSPITGQPVPGRRRGGGQRFGEMEVWALLAHGAWNLLREMLTVKADDKRGREILLDNIRQNQTPMGATVRFPETLWTLRDFLRGLALELEFLDEKDRPIPWGDEITVDRVRAVRIRPVCCRDIMGWGREVKKWEELKECDMSYIRLRGPVKRPLASDAQSQSHDCSRPCGTLCVIPVIPARLRPEPPGQVVDDLTFLYRKVLETKDPKWAYRLWKKGLSGLRMALPIMGFLEGKKGLFRRHLLGKRQDFSGRAVIVPDPDLRLSECRLPCEMVETWMQTLWRREERHEAPRPGSFRMGEALPSGERLRLWDSVFSEKHRYVLLNRQPTLHRYNLMAFRPKVWEDDRRVIGIPPMVCAGYNADFDGDTMAVYLPLTGKAAGECERLLPIHHTFKAANGELILHLGQDIAFGASLLAEDPQRNGELQRLLGAAIPNPLTKKDLVNLVTRRLREPGSNNVEETLFQLQKMAFEAASCGRASFGYFDILEARGRVGAVNVTGGVSRRKNEENKRIEDEIWGKITDMWDNSFIRWFLTGARGDRAQLRQILGPIGYVRKEDNTWLGPIMSGFVSGLTPNEYWQLCHSTRRVMMDKKLEVAEAGDLTRRLVEGAYEMRIVCEDCGNAADGIDIIEDYKELYVGRIRTDTGRPLEEQDLTGGVSSWKVRSPLTCQAEGGICQRCYGHVPGTQDFPPLGAMVGILAAQSVGEPGTQLSMRTFHTGGTPLSVKAVRNILVEGKGKGTHNAVSVIPKLLEIYGKSVAPVHFEVLLRAAQAWGQGSLDRAARDIDRRGWLAVASFERLGAVLKRAYQQGGSVDRLQSVKTKRVILGKEEEDP